MESKRGEHIYSQSLINQVDDEILMPIGGGEAKGLDAPVLIKLYTQDGQYTWYVSEFDGQDVCFGLIVDHDIRLGYFSLAVLKDFRSPSGSPVKRDTNFEVKALRDLIRVHRRTLGRRLDD